MNGVSVVRDDVAKLMATIRAMGNDGDVLVGIPADEDARADSPIGNAAIGYIQEKGSSKQGIPPRPFLEPGVAKVAKQCADVIGKGAITALTDMNPQAVLTAKNKAGLIAQNSVKATITAGDGFEPLSESTLAARKRRGVSRTKPLIDTGSLRNSITYVIRKGKN
jgi:hypothetical protein